MRKGQYPTYVDPCLGEVFSIGVTILSSGTLEDTDTLYRLNPYELRRDRLQQLLFKFKEKYSDYLYQTVTSMVEVNPQQRRKASSIAQVLIEYEEQIMDLEPFLEQTPQGYQPHRHSQAPFQGYNQPPGPIYGNPVQSGVTHGGTVPASYPV